MSSPTTDPAGLHPAGHTGEVPGIGPHGQGGGGASFGPPGEWIWTPAPLSTEIDGQKEPSAAPPVTDTAASVVEGNEKNFVSAFSEMKKLNINGVIMNKLLVWMDIQKDTIPPDTWKAHLKSLYTDKDIIEAKTVLFETVGGNEKRIGQFKNHNDNAKGNQKHIDDLIDAAEKLWNNDEMPLLVASSKMIKGMRNYNMVDTDHVNLADAINKIKQVEDTLKACLNENNAQVKNLAEVVASVGQGSSNERQENRQPPTNRVSSLIKDNPIVLRDRSDIMSSL